jgi:putative ABC transport system permease protein
MPDNLWPPDGVISLQQDIAGQFRTKMLVLLGAIGLVLLIACVNVANLLLARAATRQCEMAVRAALGAGRSRICRQLLTECVLLAICGGVLGLGLAWKGLSWLKAVVPADTPRLASVSIDARALLFTAAIAILTGFVFGLVPALHISRVDLTQSLKTGSKNSAGASHRLRSALAVSEIALAVVLVTAAGLMVRSLWELTHVNPGFQVESIVAARITPSGTFCNNFAVCQTFYNDLLNRVSALPGVRNAALVNVLPLNGRVAFIAADVEDHPAGSTLEDSPLLFDTVVTPGYLELMGIPVLEGRAFTPQDSAPNAQPVALITAATARKYWPGRDPIGKHVRAAWKKDWSVIVGVTGAVREATLAARLPSYMDGAIYEPYGVNTVLQNRKPAVTMTLVIRGATDQPGLADSLRGIVASLNSDVPVSEITPLQSVVSKSVAAPRSTMSLFAIFALLALALGMGGIYGVVSYYVEQRTPEIGIRMAMGAQRRDILRLVIGQGTRMALLGVALGISGALVLTRTMSSLLYGVSATDPVTFAAVAILLTLVAQAACYIPARRATRVDPMVALRHE